MHTTKLPFFSIRVTEVCILGSVTYARLIGILTTFKKSLTLQMGHASNLGARALVVHSPGHAEQ